MVTGLEEEKLWIQRSYRTGEELVALGYSYPRHTGWVVPPWPNQAMRPMREHFQKSSFLTFNA